MRRIDGVTVLCPECGGDGRLDVMVRHSTPPHAEPTTWTGKTERCENCCGSGTLEVALEPDYGVTFSGLAYPAGQSGDDLVETLGLMLEARLVNAQDVARIVQSILKARRDDRQK